MFFESWVGSFGWPTWAGPKPRHFNPHGFLFHIGAFSQACADLVGPATLADTWFPGPWGASVKICLDVRTLTFCQRMGFPY